MNPPVISNLLSEKLRLGINLYPGIRCRSTRALDGYIHRKLPELLARFRENLPPGFEFSRRLYREFRVDPTKHRPSSEALWRRLKNRGDFPRVNPFVDLTNLLSLRHQVCFGLYDLDKVSGDISISLGGEGDRFQGIRKDLINLTGKITVSDSQGPFGNPSSDSLRTCVSPDTRNVLQILFFHIEDPGAETVTRRAFEDYLKFFDSTNPDTVMR